MTINLIPLYQGESDYRTFTYKINGVAVNLSTLLDIRILFTDEKGVELAKYSLVPATGWNSDDFVIVSESGGVFGVKIQASETSGWTLGIAKMEIDIKKLETGFDPNFKRIYAERIFEVLPSKIAAL